jgi:hypothetical protein
MPPRRSDSKSRRADAGTDPQLRKLDESLASLRSAAREFAARRGQVNVLRVSAARWRANAESSVAQAEAARRLGFIDRVVARLRALTRKLLGPR